ncbi:pyridoxamine 5'-phosphate oxidase family protein [Nocardia cyriacigeorgica]|jgi:PPOX class probable F420-dependent enzyme|uniref:pyridoxamine 5'-phosphate oxidase family protein n=1 Tax=Nocardia cyriacigeorgica TaxID=135487 RepID=UPI0002E3D6EB|nr:PPOX class F420-dependent oxidoreductase [Nocardia cyriacigeorgica]AVH22840.1 PPOX class F420-dependent oxidoreductase [Nocardia cyriacigeorgica]MBF6089526.1 PPOX class F420-dependent oxidoreductase [Nocardia cyriacigeorgica]MBF6325700.1 PPOX class F420-dependent oxidoreductase [Nocardia cyriacigeorgica]MBF6345048.1 PPOX class F420-dependent oxidoreductase [Nocardia cyriacigeorgica]PPJ16544.1 PPOX class F420-dependent oxidoreductase [Nocardia cyriacigeorgica]
MGVNQRSQIVMSDSEITDFLTRSRVATLATLGASGAPHLTAMWYALIDAPDGGLPELWFETKAKSQKAVNMRRDPRVTCMVEAGQTYDTLRGVSIEGRAEIIDDPEKLFAVGVSVWERYTGPYSEEMRPFVETMLNKRVAVRVVADRIRSWDHRKLGLPEMPLGGTTAHALDD